MELSRVEWRARRQSARCDRTLLVICGFELQPEKRHNEWRRERFVVGLFNQIGILDEVVRLAVVLLQTPCAVAVVDGERELRASERLLSLRINYVFAPANDRFE